MKFQQAMEIVYDLAFQNALEIDDQRPEELQNKEIDAEAELQDTALVRVLDFMQQCDLSEFDSEDD